MSPPQRIFRSLFFDANLLLLLIVGRMDRGLLQRFKRTSHFKPTQYDDLLALLKRSTRMVTTPHILTEVSNLANALHDEQKDSFVLHFRSVVDALDEIYVTARVLADDPACRFGIADVSMLHCLDVTIILTEDQRFANEISRRSTVPVMTLNRATAIAKAQS